VDLNYLLIWLVTACCLLMLVQAVRARRRGWTVVFALVLAVVGALVVWARGAAGYVGGGAWLVLVLVPLVGYRMMFRLAIRARYREARRLAALLRWLHPADGWRELPFLLRALESGQRSAIAESVALLQQRNTSRTGIGRLSVAILYRLDNRWDELRDWIEEHLTIEELRRDANMAGLYLRAHGELDDPNALVEAFARLSEGAAGHGSALFRSLFRLIAFAFCGRRELVERLLRGPLGLYPEPVQRFWLATADMAAGHVGPARAALESIRGECDPLTAAGIERRLAHPLPAAEEALTPESMGVLARAERELDQEERYGGRGALVRRRAYATLALVGLNLAVFGVELAFGGSTDLETLHKLGALAPSAVAAGEWWRALTALFLHYGFLHLLVNMLALLILGPFLEFAVGAGRYLLVYVLAGAGSMLGIAALAQVGYLEDHIVVGASGSIMGLVGATAAVLLRGWARERAWIASRRLTVLAFVIVFQIVFDLATPEVSFTAHLGGVVIGFVAALLLRDRLSRAAAPAATHRTLEAAGDGLSAPDAGTAEEPGGNE